MATLPRAVAVIGFNLDTIAAVLERNDQTDAALDVRFAYDHEEAAGFIATRMDRIATEWQGPAHELDHLRAFVREFAGRPPQPGAPG